MYGSISMEIAELILRRLLLFVDIDGEQVEILKSHHKNTSTEEIAFS